MKKKKIVDYDFFDSLKEDLPRIRENTRPKMISEEELKLLFKTFGKELKRKEKLPEFDPDLVQNWFKPIIALYFYCGLRKINLFAVNASTGNSRDTQKKPVYPQPAAYTE